jgi:hypothetical protein
VGCFLVRLLLQLQAKEVVARSFASGEILTQKKMSSKHNGLHVFGNLLFPVLGPWYRLAEMLIQEKLWQNSKLLLLAL